MKRKKLTASLLQVSLILACVLFSCGDEATPPTETDTASTETDVTTAPAESKKTLYTESLEPVDFGGAEFNVTTSNYLGASVAPTVQNFATEINGEIINDTLFERDTWLEETYNIDLQMHDDLGNDWGKHLTLLQSGDFPYDMIINDLGMTRLLSQNNLLVPLNMMDQINLDAQYWFPELNTQLKIGEDHYFTACAISPRYYTSTYVIMFNRDLAADLDLPDLYDSVKTGTWTIEQMSACAKSALRDVNGDGEYDENDIWGFMHEGMTSEAMILGTGHHTIEVEGDSLRITLEDEFMVNLIKQMETIFTSEYTVLADIDSLDASKIYSSGNCLFYNPVAFSLYEFREFTYDYGILPMPKYDVSQDKYYVYAQPYANATAMIPMTLDPECHDMIGTLTDAMAAYGYDYIRPAVFENVVKLKSARDEQSAEIIDLMYENVTFELATILNPASLADNLLVYLWSEVGKQEFTGRYAAIKSKTEAALQDILENYRAHHDYLEKELGK